MRISILYFEGCPNHPPVVELARRVVAEHALSAIVEEIEVAPDEVVQRRFLGSPTVQVDGVDIEPAARDRSDFAMSCRVYSTPDGLPSEEMLLSAVGAIASTASRATTDRAGLLSIGGSVVTASLSSACCWIPLLLLTFGASAAGTSAFFERTRPFFIVVAVTMLGLGFYFSYFRTTACADGRCGDQSRRGRHLQRVLLWGSAVVVTAFIVFPDSIGLFLNRSRSIAGVSTADSLEPEAREYSFEIDGMSCESCAVVLQNELVKIDGVIDAQVNYADKNARLWTTTDGIVAQVADVASRTGYTITPHDEKRSPPGGATD